MVDSALPIIYGIFSALQSTTRTGALNVLYGLKSGGGVSKGAVLKWGGESKGAVLKWGGASILEVGVTSRSREFTNDTYRTTANCSEGYNKRAVA